MLCHVRNRLSGLPFPVPWWSHHQPSICFPKRCHDGHRASIVTSSHGHHTLAPLYTIKDKPTLVRLHHAGIPTSPLFSLLQQCEATVCVHGSQESGTYQLLRRDRHPTASLRWPTNFFFVRTGALPPLFGDCQLSSGSCQHDILSQTRRLGRRRGLRSVPFHHWLLEQAREMMTQWRGRKGMSGGGAVASWQGGECATWSVGPEVLMGLARLNRLF
jgi:hypothetical protein